MNRKGQGIIEFIVIFGAVFLFFIIFLSIIQQNIADKKLEKERYYARNIALNVQSEISLANSVSDGYSREFTVPGTIIGKEYEINITQGTVYITADKLAMAYKVLNVTGDLVKGKNLIRRANGQIFLN